MKKEDVPTSEDKAVANEDNAGTKGEKEGDGYISKKEFDGIKDRMLRLAAEFDNYKKRMANDSNAARESGIAEIVKALLNIIDEFDFTLIAASKSDDKNLVRGIELLYANFSDVLKKFGLAEIEASGKFDPYRHEIIMVREDEKGEGGRILEVIKKGYVINGRLLRAASVIVSKEPAAEEGDGEETGKDGDKK